jgi:rRNA small subunit pseudouridine methyltransferase Nep1
MLTLLLADAELERVPASLTGHPQVATSARRVGASAPKMLLDSSLHHAAMRKLEDGERRGRPDIVHLFLLTGLEAPVSKQGDLRLLVHTRENYLLRVEPRTRLVRNYGRFCGLIQQLFETGRVPPENPLLTLEPNWKVSDIVAQERPDRVIIMDETGTATPPWHVFSAADVGRHTLCIIGGFPSGTFRSNLPDAPRVSFGPEQLAVWTVAGELLFNYERVRGEASADVAPPT